MANYLLDAIEMEKNINKDLLRSSMDGLIAHYERAKQGKSSYHDVWQFAQQAARAALILSEIDGIEFNVKQLEKAEKK